MGGRVAFINVNRSVKKETESDAPGSKERVQCDCRPEGLNFVLGEGLVGISVRPFILLRGRPIWKRKGERKGAGVGIIWHQDATGGAWESPIVLPFSNTLLFHLVGRTTLYTRPVLRSKLAFGGSLCMWNIVEILMNAARLLSHAAVACSTVLKCLNTGCNSK